MDGPRPSSFTAPSTWNAAVAAPHRKSFGNAVSHDFMLLILFYPIDPNRVSRTRRDVAKSSPLSQVDIE
jgi:hypothetical protein